jgi:cellulose biosynthesis protein BcsQ
MEIAERFLPVRKDYENILRRTLRDSINNSNQKTTTTDRYKTNAVSESNNWKSSGYAERIYPSLNYDFVIIDCPPFMGAVTLNALVAADLLIIPTQPEFFSAHALKTMMSTIRQVREQFNRDLIYRILITMFDRRNRIHRDVKQHIQTTFEDGVFLTNIGVDTKLRESAVEGVPISHHKKSSRGALQYDALAQELIAYVR